MARKTYLLLALAACAFAVVAFSAPATGSTIPVDLVTSLRASQPAVESGGRFDYTISAHNLGTSSSSNVELWAELPANARLLSAGPSCQALGGGLSCGPAAVGNGDSGYDASVVVSMQAPCSAVDTAIQARAWSSSVDEAPAAGLNNEASLETKVLGCPDLVGDGKVGMQDQNELARRWGLKRGDAGYKPAYDINSDGAINMGDLTSMAAQWGKTCGKCEPAQEIRQYDGQQLSSINDFVENSLLGPQYIDVNRYRLVIDGNVARPQSLTYYDIIATHPIFRKVAPLTCVDGWTVNILWEGVHIYDLIAEAQPGPGASMVSITAVDGYGMTYPLSWLRDNQIIMAHKINGVTMPPERGFPFKLVAEGMKGYRWAKWIIRITVI